MSFALLAESDAAERMHRVGELEVLLEGWSHAAAHGLAGAVAQLFQWSFAYTLLLLLLSDVCSAGFSAALFWAVATVRMTL